MNTKEHFFIRFLKDNWIILLISSFNFFILLIPNFFGYYSYAPDEFYFIACSKMLALGYVDHPPFATYLLSIIRLFSGDSILAIRLLPALANASLVFLIGIITKRLGGKKFAQGLASFAFSIIPLYLMINSYYSMNAFEPLLLTCCVLVLIIIIQDNKPKHWLLLGLIIGIGLINKHTFVVFGVAILIGIILTPLRKYFKNKYFWLGILIVIIIVLPNIFWQIQYDFVSFKLYKNDGTVATPVLMLIPIVAFALNPLVFPICLLGIVYLFFKTEGKPYRVFGWMFLLSFVFFITMDMSRIDRVAPVYPILIASGSIMLELWIKKIHKDWLKPFIISILLIGGIFSFLVSLPIFPPKVLHEYAKSIELRSQEYEGSGKTLLMSTIHMHHKLFAVRLGWEAMVKDVASVYNRLSEQDKEKAVILSLDHAEAGAIEFFGSKYNLPMIISTRLNYRIWGYGNATGDLMIVIGSNKDVLDLFFEKVELSGIIHACDYCFYYKENIPIYICRKLKIPIFDLFYFHILYP